MKTDIKYEARKTIETLRTNIMRLGFTTGSMIERQYNYEVTVNNYHETLKVQTYFGKKGVKTVLQGNQQTEVYNSVNDILNGQIQISFQKKIKHDKFADYIGTDESGKGDLFGPLVVAAFYYDDSLEKEFAELKVRDSKEIYDEEIRNIAEWLLENYPKRIEKKILLPAEYNSLYPKYNNLNKLLAEVHGNLILKLRENVKCDNIIIDKFAGEYRFDKIFAHEKINLSLIEKAEKFQGVAAASIIARYFMIEWFRNNKFRSKTIPKGSSTDAIGFAKNLMDEFNNHELTKFAKLHFKTFRR